MTKIQFANRLQPLQYNLFADMDAAKSVAVAAGKELIDLSLGSSDLPVDDYVLGAISESIYDPSTHGYLLFRGTQRFRETVAQWYEKKFGVPVNPDTEVLALIGSQEGTAHLPLAILNPGDFALLLDPGYPSHAGGVHLASGQIYTMPLKEENNFLPVLTDIPPSILSQSKMMVLSYPHNPTSAIAPLSFFQEAVEFCQQHNIVLVHDFPYGDVVFTEDATADNQSIAPSIFQADREKSISIEFFSMSKSYNMGGFRIGYAIGNAELILALKQLKATIDFNQYLGILNGAIAALSGDQKGIKNTVTTFRKRRDIFIKSLEKIGWQVPTPKATSYIWAKLPEPWSNNSIKFCTELVKQTGVAASPGVGFGASGEGYVRFALVRDASTLEIAVSKIGEFIDKTRMNWQ